MSMYEIRILKKANKFIQSRNAKEKQRIYGAIYKLPYGTDIIKMQKFKNRYRLRIGGYRITYEKDDDILVIKVIEADNRGDIY